VCRRLWLLVASWLAASFFIHYHRVRARSGLVLARTGILARPWRTFVLRISLSACSARQNLEERVAERTRELATLLEISHNVASTLELEPVLGMILDQLRTVVAYDAASTMVLDDGGLSILAHRGPIPHQEPLGLSFSVDEAGANRAVIQRRPFVVADSSKMEPPVDAGGLPASVQDLSTTTRRHFQASVTVPLLVEDEVYGSVAL
jgi:transcriptional regulator with GAF, ATPase, and Fis domain